MAYENSGIISKNKFFKNEGQPQITGKATVGGVEYKVAGWSKVGKDGPFYSLKFTDVNDEPKKMEPSNNDIDDNIPF